MDKKVLVEGMRRQNGDFVCARKSEKKIKTYGQTGKKKNQSSSSRNEETLAGNKHPAMFPQKKVYTIYIYIPSTKTHLDSDETKTLVDDLKKHIGSYHPVL